MTLVSRDQLRSIVERIERLHEERKAIADDIRDLYAEAKGNGFDVKALKAVVSIRSKDADELQNHQAIVDLYMDSLGSHVHVREAAE